MLPYVVKVNRKHDNFTLYIGREMPRLLQSKWHNPFHVWQCDSSTDCIRRYEKYIRGNVDLMAAIHELSDQALGCWCYPNFCHGDVLVRIYKELAKPGVGDMASAISEDGCLVLPEPRMIVDIYDKKWARFDGQLGFYPLDLVIWPGSSEQKNCELRDRGIES
jgi:hypothetical protein